MSAPPASLFFALHRFAHRELLNPDAPPWSALLELKNYLSNWGRYQIEIDLPPHVHLERPELISIGKRTILEPGVYIQGPCIIGKNCIIRHGAYLRGSVICGDHCAIGHSAELKNAILLDYASATHFVYVGDSILGNWVNLGAGVKCANLRIDRKEVVSFFESQKLKTGLKKLGAVIGDRCQIGCNSVLNPGTLMGPESVCPPLISLSGYIPPRSQIKQPLSWTIEPIAETILENRGK